MADWTNIPDSVLEPGDPVRSVDALALRDNPIAIAERATGAPPVLGTLKSVQVFTANGTWTKPATGIGHVLVEVIGGGGGGGGADDTNDAPGGGGGAGGYARKVIDVKSISSATITHGAGGSAGSGGAGGSGGTSSWADGTNTVSAPGGAGGGAGSTVGGLGGLGGTGTGGDWNGRGGPGHPGIEIGVNDIIGGTGGSIAPYGVGGLATRGASNVGRGFGGGGSGGGGTSGADGGAGAGGIIIVWEF